MGLLKSGMGIGGLLLEGIGDTIRVSLAADPEKEVEAGFNILRAVGFPVAGPEVITCPTCGRTRIDLIPMAEEVERRLMNCTKNITVAVMGCAVNGPGEAREADLGVASGNGKGQIFVKGEVIKTVPEEDIVQTLIEEANRIAREMEERGEIDLSGEPTVSVS